MTPHGRPSAPWTERELTLVRDRTRTLENLAALLPHRTPAAIRQKRKRLRILSAPPALGYMAELGRRSGAARRVLSIARRNRVIAAIAAGAVPSRTGLVSRATIALWRRKDPAFHAWLTGFYATRRAERRARAAVARSARRKANTARNRKGAQAASAFRARRAAIGENLRTSLRNCDIYETARRAIGDLRPDHIRDSAISNLVLALLEGTAAPDTIATAARMAIAAARGEISRVSIDAPDRSGRTMLDRLAAAPA